MFPSTFFSTVRQDSVSPRFSLPRRGLNTFFLAAAVTLALSLPAAVQLGAQAAHFAGAVVTLGSGFSTPTGVAVDGNGNVFVADNGNSAVKEIVAVNGRIPASPTINTLGSGFANPFTVAVDGSGNVFLTDYGHHEVKEIVAVNGSIPPSPTIRILGSGFGFLFGSAVDGSGDVFVTDYGKNEVKEIVAVNGSIPSSPKILVLGSGFNIPAGVSLDGSGNVFVGDQNNNVLKEILAAGGYTTTNTVATGFSTPDGVAVDKNGNVFVADDGNNQVKEVVAVNGSIPVSPTIITLGSGYLQPFDVAVDGNDNVYVADRGNNAVKEIQTAGGSFGPVNVGTTTLSPITFSFTFDTGGTLGSTAVLSLGNSGQDFYDSGGGTCTANTAYLAGNTCTVNVKFNPLAPGPRYGAVELLSATGSLLATGYVQGIGVGPQVTFSNTTSGVSFPADVVTLGSGFSGPGGLAVDGSGNVFVGDSNNNQVKKIVAAGGWTTVDILGSGFNNPNGVALDGSGNIFVADTFNDAVKEIVAVGGYSEVISLGSGFSNPYGVAVDGYGNVFVADFANNAVKEMIAVDGSIPASPTIRTLASGLEGPDGVAVDGSGDVFVANYGDSTVREIVAVNGSIPASPTIKTIGSGFSSPSNLSVDGIGNVFVSDTGNSQVKEIVAAGGYTNVKILGSGFSSPEAAAVFQNGDVIVADTDNNVVDLLDYADTPSLTFANTAKGFTSIDSPQTVTVSNDGNAALTFPQPGTGANPSVSANFAWDPSSTCTQTTSSSPAAFALAGGASCTMAFDFKPATAGAFSGNAVLTDNDLNQAGAVQTIQLAGTGLQNPQTIAFTQPASPVNYGVAPVTLIATGGASGNPVTFSIASGPGSLSGTNNSVLTVTGVGTIVIAANQAGNGSYAAAAPVQKTITVNRAVLKVAAYNYTRVYATALPASFAYSVTGFVNGETQSVVSGTPSITTTAVEGSPVKAYPITPALGSLSAANYTFQFQAGMLTITPAVLKVAAFNYTRVYATALPTSFAYSVSGFVNGDTQSVVSGTPSITTTAVVGSPVKTYPITPALGSLSTANYTFQFQAGTLTITPAVLKVAANNETITLGSAIPTTFSYTITGFVNGDTKSVVSGTPSITTTAMSSSPAGAYPITPTLGTLSATNYTFTFQAGTLTITP